MDDTLEVKRADYFGEPFAFEFFDPKIKKHVGSVVGSRAGKVCFIIFIYVYEQYRRKGYSKRMIAELQKCPFEYMRTEWHASTKAGRNALKKMGFKRDGKWLTWHRETAS